ncbi:hypothetical protein [Mesorhizobium sp.]|uniref:hypothetical protein n=1 Tax=Mesorhizobium sp. TaxID=1871066 RepID=UPI00257BFD05|nr:hypothetical protein [Mesorhizobium sp.]
MKFHKVALAASGRDNGPPGLRWAVELACLEIKGSMTMTISPFLTALGSEGPPADRAKDMNLYGWLIGSWEMDTVHYRDDGTIQKWDGECHFGWVLEGRAIQDVWIRPKRPAPSTMYGTTLRIFDPGIDGWHIIWNDPLNRDHSRQIGRAEGKEIVQLGTDSRGLKTRWRFTEITASSFHWIGEERSSESDPWQITYEHLVRRTKP